MFVCGFRMTPWRERNGQVALEFPQTIMDQSDSHKTRDLPTTSKLALYHYITISLHCCITISLYHYITIIWFGWVFRR